MVDVGKLVYDIEADIANFQQGMTATRKELGMAKKVIQQNASATDRYNEELLRLNELHRKGALSTKQFRQAVKGARDEMARGTVSLRGMMVGIKGLPGPLMAAGAAMLSFAGAQRAVRGLLDEMGDIDNIAKTARKLGETTEELVGLQLAAEEFSGFTDSQLNMALQRMTRRIAEAAAGTGEAKQAIKDLGLDAKDLNRAGPAEAFRQIADAMRGVNDSGTQLRLAFKLFDSEGAGLVNTLNAGSAELNAMRERAKELGLTFNDIDAAQVEAANDAITEAKAAWEGATRSFTTTFAPVIKLAAQRIEQMANRLKAVRDGFLATQQAAEQFFKDLLGVRTESIENPFTLRADDQQQNMAFLDAMHAEREAFNEDQRKRDIEAAEQIEALKSKETRDRIRKINEQYKREVQERIKAAEEMRQKQERERITDAADAQVEQVEKVRDRMLEQLQNRMRLADQERTQGGGTALRAGSAEEFKALARMRNREMNTDKQLQEQRNQLLEQIKERSDDMIEAIRDRQADAIEAI